MKTFRVDILNTLHPLCRNGAIFDTVDRRKFSPETFAEAPEDAVRRCMRGLTGRGTEFDMQEVRVSEVDPGAITWKVIIDEHGERVSREDIGQREHRHSGLYANIFEIRVSEIVPVEVGSLVGTSIREEGVSRD